MDEVSAHGVEEVGVLINDILIIKEELIWLQQLLLFYVQHVLLDIITHDLVVFHVVIRNGLAAEHYQVVGVHHMKPNEPDSTIHYCV